MISNPQKWYPVAVLFGVLNLIGFGYALGGGEPTHAAAHIGLMLGSWAWARRLRERRDETPEEARVEAAGGSERLEDLEAEMDSLRRQLSETQERLDFTERMLAQRPEPRRVDPQR